MKGWFNQRYRHSLAARGIRTNFAMEDVERDQLLEQNQLMKLVNPLLGVALEKQNRELMGSPEAQEEFIYKELGTASPEVWHEIQVENRGEDEGQALLEILNSNNFVIYFDEMATGITEPLHFERRRTPDGVVWVGEFPTKEGILTRSLDFQRLISFIEQNSSVITNIEEA